MRVSMTASVLVLGLTALSSRAQQADKPEPAKTEKVIVEGKPPDATPRFPPSPPDSITENTVTVGGQRIEYRAVAGTITVGSTDAYDAMLGADGQLLPDAARSPPAPAKPEDPPARARMFYAAYFRKGVEGSRPVIFIYNGGPGSSTMWLHM